MATYILKKGIPVIVLAGLCLGGTCNSRLGAQIQDSARWSPGTVFFEVNCGPGRSYIVQFYSDAGKLLLTLSGKTEPVPPRIVGKKVLGALGQTKQETAIYSDTNTSSKVLYRTASMEYLIINPSKSDGWLKVPLQNGTNGFVVEAHISKLPYDATVGETVASPSDKSLVVISPDRMSTYAPAKVIGVGKYQMIVDIMGGLSRCLNVSVMRDVTNIGTVNIQFGDSDCNGKLDNGDVEYIKNLLGTHSDHPLWYELDVNGRAPYFADANLDGVIDVVDLNLIKSAKQRRSEVPRGSKSAKGKP
ncbi:MAG: hypothetical protein K8H99_12900 [Nitrospirae bacterium]|nr:hypothetical protein [Fimbriimonadaceae bacterium]